MSLFVPLLGLFAQLVLLLPAWSGPPPRARPLLFLLSCSVPLRPAPSASLPHLVAQLEPHSCTLLSLASTSAPGLGSPAHICTGTGLTPPTSAPGLGAPLPAHPFRPPSRAPARRIRPPPQRSRSAHDAGPGGRRSAALLASAHRSGRAALQSPGGPPCQRACGTGPAAQVVPPGVGAQPAAPDAQLPAHGVLAVGPHWQRWRTHPHAHARAHTIHARTRARGHAHNTPHARTRRCRWSAL